jgi:phosphoribosylaminoimidazole-succinocarboxamide synthase
MRAQPDDLKTRFSGIQADRLAGRRVRHGKVRDVVEADEHLLIVTSDRVSAFDHVLSTVPFKGEILNRLSAYWFDVTAEVAENHFRHTVGSRGSWVSRCDPLPVEVVVRGYLTGSAWRDYRAGSAVSGVELPAGLREYEKLPEPVVTPSTKAEIGTHDEPISAEGLVERGVVSREIWSRVHSTALALFGRGSEVAASRGLILVDTKYEFGLKDGKLVLIDELHTPDSSRYWFAEGYEESFRSASAPRRLDKEFLRAWLMDRGFTGNGRPPEIPGEILIELSNRYIEAFELITGSEFESKGSSPKSDLQEIEYFLMNAQH